MNQLRYKKGSLIWWNLSKSKIPRPAWIPITRFEQAGEIADVDLENQVAVILIMNEERVMESFVVPLKQIRPREIPR